MIREEILDVIVDLYEQFEISEFGFDLIKFIKKMEINLIPYSGFDIENQIKLIKYDEDGFNIINPKNNRIEIYYNDRIIPKRRIKFTLPHEIGHISLGHNCKLGNETTQQKKEINSMYKVKIINEFMHGAIWVYDDDGISIDYNLIDDDSELQELNKRTEELYNSYYEFDSHDQPVWFNEELERETSYEMLELIDEIKNRLSAINDGTFIVEDNESGRLKELL